MRAIALCGYGAGVGNSSAIYFWTDITAFGAAEKHIVGMQHNAGWIQVDGPCGPDQVKLWLFPRFRP